MAGKRPNGSSKHLPEATLLHFATHGNLSEEAHAVLDLLADGESITLYELMGIQSWLIWWY
ncbi:MAG: hypothetical protein R2825_27700 [Saprospiraceae bacterium]